MKKNNKRVSFLTLLSILGISMIVVPLSLSTYVISPSDAKINVYVSKSEEIPPLEININYNETYDSQTGSEYDTYKTITLNPNESTSLYFNVSSLGYVWTNGNRSYVSKIETLFSNLDGTSVLGLSGTCKALYSNDIRSYYKDNTEQNTFDIADGFGGINFALPKNSSTQFLIELNNTSNDILTFKYEISSLPSENYSYAYIVGSMSNPSWEVGDSYFIMSPALYVNNNIGIGESDFYWEWIATDANSAINYNNQFKGKLNSTWSSGDNYVTNGFKVDQISWTGKGDNGIICHHI